MKKNERDELITLLDEIRKLRDEVQQSRQVIYVPQPYPVYPVYPAPVYPYQPYRPYITWGAIPMNGTSTITVEGNLHTTGCTVSLESIQNSPWNCGSSFTAE
jgi:hypothetical protein